MANPIKANPLVALNALQRLNLSFPDDVETYHTHYIIFTVYKTKREGRTATDKTTPIARIKLPMTQELKVDYNAGYSNPDLGAVGALASSALENLAASTEGKGFDLGAIAKAAADAAAKAIVQAPSIVGGAALEFASKGGSTAQGSVAGVQAFGVARNPHKATLFEGTEFRSHSFSFRFSPVKASESDAIRNIIALFKYHMHPGYTQGEIAGAGNHFFSTPEFFKIELSNEGKYTVNDYQTCVLKAMSVNYQPSNYPAYARVAGSDPAPMEVIMDLQFQETEIITKEVFGNPYTQDARDSQSKTQMPKNSASDITGAVNGTVTGLTNAMAGIAARGGMVGMSGTVAPAIGGAENYIGE